MPWIGRKKIAFVPVFRPNARPPDVIPADWTGDILRRVLYDPDTTSGADRSLRTYIQKASSGRADLDVVVMPMVVIDQQDVPVDALEGQFGADLRNQGFDAAALVMLGGVGAGTALKGGFWARFVMVEKLGTWAMELMHCLTGFDDIRSRPSFVDSPNGEGEMGAFDEMATNNGTHPSAYTKAAIDWLDESAIARHTGRAAGFDLHAVGLTQPPPFGRSTAVRIGSGVPYLMVEARMMADQFESPSQLEPGIPSQGVIVYRVQTTSPLGSPQNNLIPVFLLTPTALKPGTPFTSDTGVRVQVISALPGGFSVLIDEPVPWTSVSEGSSTPGGHVTAVATDDDQITLFIADPNGGIYTTSGNSQVGWKPWNSVSEGSSTPGAPVTAVVTGNRIALFVAGINGAIWATSGKYEDGWGPWRSVSEGSSTPGGHVAPVVTGDRIALFLADPNGGIYTTSGKYEDGWGPWRSVSEGSSTPGAPVTAVVIGDRVTLFLADPNGGIYTTSGKYEDGWGPWRSASEGSTTPGGHVTAVVTGDDQITLFLADPNGGIYTTSGNYQVGWGPWKSVSEGSTSPGGHVTAIVTSQDRISLFIADPNGGIYTTSGNYQVGWEPWNSVSEGSSTPGAPVTAVVTGGQITLFLADANGGIYARTKSLQ